MVKYDKNGELLTQLEVENLNKRYKSLLSGKLKTVIPHFQPVIKTKNINKDDKKANDENTNNKKIKDES